MKLIDHFNINISPKTSPELSPLHSHCPPFHAHILLIHQGRLYKLIIQWVSKNKTKIAMPPLLSYGTDWQKLINSLSYSVGFPGSIEAIFLQDFSQSIRY